MLSTAASCGGDDSVAGLDEGNPAVCCSGSGYDAKPPAVDAAPSMPAAPSARSIGCQVGQGRGAPALGAADRASGRGICTAMCADYGELPHGRPAAPCSATEECACMHGRRRCRRRRCRRRRCGPPAVAPKSLQCWAGDRCGDGQISVGIMRRAPDARSGHWNFSARLPECRPARAPARRGPAETLP